MRRNVLIVDDSPVFCRIMATVLRSIERVNVVGIASSSERALELAGTRDPDLVTLDVLMPGQDGLATLRALRRDHPKVKVLMVSSRTRRGAVETVESLQLGASDYLQKPSGSEGGGGLEALARGLRAKLDALLPARARPPVRIHVPRTRSEPSSIDVVAIACSTGGPEALGEVLSRLGSDFPVPILVVQHILPEFVPHLIRTLARRTGLKLTEATEGAPLRSGSVYFAPTGVHTLVGGDALKPVFTHQHGAALHGCKPAADVLFQSLPAVFGERVLSLVLTGTGEDGSAGSAAVRGAGGWVVVQQPHECVAYGMPRATLEAGHADEALSLSQLPARISELAWQGRR